MTAYISLRCIEVLPKALQMVSHYTMELRFRLTDNEFRCSISLKLQSTIIVGCRWLPWLRRVELLVRPQSPHENYRAKLIVVDYCEQPLRHKRLLLHLPQRTKWRED